MDDITSFNTLFVEARRARLRLEYLREDDHGFWSCGWRRDGGLFETTKRRLPFNAMLDAFNEARAPAAVDTDLFG